MQSWSRSRTRYFGGLVLALLAISVSSGCKKPPPKPQPPEVETVTLSPTNVPIVEEWIGTLDGLVNAQIRAQVSGYLLAQHYAEGSKVRKGDWLFEIDPRPFEAALNQARAKLAQDGAQLGKTELDVKRYTPLAKEQAISQEQLDDAVQAQLAAEAQVKADEAAVQNAELNLEFCRITSPIDGLAGLALAQIGDLVSPSSGALTTISVLNPVRVFFQVNEHSYLKFWRHFAAPPEGQQKPVALQLVLSDGTVYAEQGRVFFADRQVNLDTGTLQIVGLFSNADFVLRPGQYGRVRAQTEMKEDTLVVPQQAVMEVQGTYQVAVVGETNRVHVQAVQVGEQVGRGWIIESGLRPGDRVVVEGTQKAKEGLVVAPRLWQGKGS